MKKTLILIIFFGAIIGTYIGITNPIGLGAANNTTTIEAEKPNAPTEKPINSEVEKTVVVKEQTAVAKKNVAEVPQRIIIPTLNVNAPVESVTVDSSGNMAVPENYNNTAWYSLGPKPGEEGSAVIDGHVDTPTGAPAVFAEISGMPAGSRIQIIDAAGKTHNFEVTSVKTYSVNAIPLEDIFSREGPGRLNLITCSGTWNKASRSYSHRTVVYSKLIR